MSDDAAGSDGADGGDADAGRTAEHAEWLDALADGDGFALVCPDGHGSLPPRRVCPECGATDLSREPFDERGTVETYTVVHVPSPRFADDAPYATAVVDFGPVRVTGVYRDGGDSVPDLEIGERVTVDVGERVTDGERLVVFRPADGE
ncbi:nucleic acid-binding protein [Halorubrum sp. BOL3-1]|uniref:Zn-ribbon domain-containing OB-fold protein n=1 Tax=Halorubrum sp. BOL3-1 TaxID=2497325 RepID=UPI00100516C9|nr:OB-fold domain-containing protein [Halorubrum sp. BOL3-1]QAU12068.1 nucleic acid-binding protein [Halorubrum sp. BOL3-1]